MRQLNAHPRHRLPCRKSCVQVPRIASAAAVSRRLPHASFRVRRSLCGPTPRPFPRTCPARSTHSLRRRNAPRITATRRRPRTESTESRNAPAPSISTTASRSTPSTSLSGVRARRLPPTERSAAPAPVHTATPPAMSGKSLHVPCAS
eukprot:2575703-Pleurochrysis_carterae.AAC.2